MHQAVIGTAELRNRFGTGHGRHRRSSGLGPRHARLVGDSQFLETLHCRLSRGQALPSAVTQDGILTPALCAAEMTAVFQPLFSALIRV